MDRTGQIQWWVAQMEAARQAVDAARDRRRRSHRQGRIDEMLRARAMRVAPLSDQTPAHVKVGGATITGGRDAERSRTLEDPLEGRAGAAFAAARSISRTTPVVGGQGGATGRARLLAAGYQPAVIKVVSYARGAARATATGQYVQREDVALETHDGRMLADREAVAEEIKAWSAGFSKRAESQDVVALWVKLHGIHDTPEGRETYEKAVAAGFEGHRYACRIDAMPSGGLEARLIVVMAGASKERFRVREEAIGSEQDGLTQLRLDVKSEAVVKARINDATGFPLHGMNIVPGATSHGRDGVTYRLTRLIEKGAAIDDRGKAISNAADIRIAAREWGRSLRSQSSRDTMHMIISAKAGTEVAALNDAARGFPHDRFADHKFMFAVHTDKEAEGHIHAHAIITVKNEDGQKIHPGRDSFRQWREVYAEHAQAQGLKIVATSARERASSQSYGPKDKAIVEVAERPRPARAARDRAYSSDPANRNLIEAARRRIRIARTNPIKLPASDSDRRAVRESIAARNIVLRESPDNAVAKDMLERLTMAHTIGAILHTIAKRTDYLTKEDQPMAITSQQMVKDLRLMNEAVSRTSDLLDGETKKQFQEKSARYLETLANRVDLQRAQERGVHQVTRAETEAIVGINADRLIARAQDVRLKEENEATTAQHLADRALEAGRREEARGGIDPERQRELRAGRQIVAGSEQSAAREAREAVAAQEAVRVLADHPAQPLPQALIQTDALAKLRAEQEKILREIESERGDVHSTKGERMR